MAMIVARPASATTPTHGFRPHRLTVERYHRMIEAGLFGEDEPIFLWKGQLVEKMTKGQPHNNALAGLIETMIRLIPAGWHVRPEQPMILGDDSEPEPDLIVVRGAIRDYRDRPPAARAVTLVIEVADSSLSADSGEMLEAYAKEGIPCYWIVNIPQGRVQVYRLPTGPADAPSYAERRDYGPDDEVPVVLDGREIGRIAVRDILP